MIKKVPPIPAALLVILILIPLSISGTSQEEEQTEEWDITEWLLLGPFPNPFPVLLEEYKKAPDVTRKRLYIESMENVLSKTKTVLVDVKGGNNLFYLPLDRMARQQPASEPQISEPVIRKSLSQRENISKQVTRSSSRGREVRGRQ